MGESAASEPKAVLFGTPTFPWCPRAKRYLADKRSEGQADKRRPLQIGDGDGREDGAIGVAVITIDTRWLIGVDRTGIERALETRGSWDGRTV